MTGWDNILFYLITNALNTVSIARFFRHGAGEKVPFRKELAAYAAYWAVISAAYLLYAVPVLMLALNLSGMVLLAGMYEKRWKSCILWAAVLYVSLLPTELVAMWLCNTVAKDVWQQQEAFSQTGQIVTCVLTALNVQLMLRFKGVRKSTAGNRVSWGSVVLILLLSVGLISLLAVHLRSGERIFAVLMLAVIDYAVIYIYDRLMLSEAERVKSLLLAEQNRSLAGEMEILKDSRKRIRGIYHDMKNHILVLRSYAEQQKYAELDEYLARMQEETQAAVPQVYTGQPAVDSMLHYKIGSAPDVPVRVEAGIPETLEMDGFDITVILGNLLDNAIEACRRLEKEERSVLLSIRLAKNQLFIRMENTFDGQLRTRQGRLLTRKEDGGVHGLGLENVRRVADKYHGLLETEAEGRIFRTKVMLYLG